MPSAGGTPVTTEAAHPELVEQATASPEHRSSGRVVLYALAPALVFLAVRAVGVLVLALMAAGTGSTLGHELTTWDGAWLLSIAEDGYAGVAAEHVDAFGNRTPETPLGFFPGYPGAVAAVGWFTFGNIALAGLLVSLGSGIFAAYGLTRLGELVPGGSRRAGLLLTALFAATPMSVVLSMTYTEALFCALAVWGLVAVLRRQWLLAGLVTAAAGLVRPTATGLVAAVGLAALAAVLARRDGIRPWAGGLLAASGLVGYLAYVAARTGRPDGWFAIQRDGWGWYLDGGRATAAYVGEVLAGGQRIFDVLTVVALVGTLVLLGLMVWLRLPWPLTVYAVLTLVTVWGTQGLMNAKLRLLVPAFVLLVPLALGLANRRRGTALAVVVAVALGSAWFGGYALTIWKYGI
jgi:hypothetical protein